LSGFDFKRTAYQLDAFPHPKQAKVMMCGGGMGEIGCIESAAVIFDD
jgi:hypothetical protein